MRIAIFSVAVFRQHYARGVVDGRPRVGGQDSSLKRGGVSLYPPFVARGSRFETPSKGASFCGLPWRSTLLRVGRKRVDAGQGWKSSLGFQWRK